MIRDKEIRWSLSNTAAILLSRKIDELSAVAIGRASIFWAESEHIKVRYLFGGRSQWPHGLKCGSAATQLLGLRVRVPYGAWMSVCCECCVLSKVSATGRLLVEGILPSVVCLIECDIKTSYRMPGATRAVKPWKKVSPTSCMCNSTPHLYYFRHQCRIITQK
jgi:hypothetical protein